MDTPLRQRALPKSQYRAEPQHQGRKHKTPRQTARAIRYPTHNDWPHDLPGSAARSTVKPVAMGLPVMLQRQSVARGTVAA